MCLIKYIISIENLKIEFGDAGKLPAQLCTIKKDLIRQINMPFRLVQAGKAQVEQVTLTMCPAQVNLIQDSAIVFAHSLTWLSSVADLCCSCFDKSKCMLCDKGPLL